MTLPLRTAPLPRAAAPGSAAAAPANAAKEHYLRERVMTASPAELTAMLFDACVGALKVAVRLQESGEHLAAGPRLLKAQDIIMELRTTLNPDAGALSGQLDALYTYAHAQLVKANVSRDAAATQEVLGIVEPLQTAWREACCTLAA